MDSRQSQGEGLLGGRGAQSAIRGESVRSMRASHHRGKAALGTEEHRKPSVGPGTQLEINKRVTEGKAQDVLS